MLSSSTGSDKKAVASTRIIGDRGILNSSSRAKEALTSPTLNGKDVGAVEAV